MRRRAERIDNAMVMEVFDGLRAEYAIGQESRYLPRMRGVDPGGTGADYHFANEIHFFKAMERARWFDRENMVVGQGLTRVIDNVLQDKLPLDPDTGSDRLDDALYDRWDEWCNDPAACHSRRTQDFHSLAKMVLRAVMVDGDVIALPLESGQLQPIEAHRLRTPRNTKQNVVHGVLLDDLGAPQEYWIAPESPDIYRRVERVGEMRRYPALDEDGQAGVFHVFNAKRLSQTRGVTAFAPLVFPAGIHDDLQFAKLVQAQVASCFALIHESSAMVTPGGTANTGAVTRETQADGTQRIIQGIAPGMTYYAPPGVKITGYSPNIPNPEFFAHAMMILTIVAVNLGIPVAVLLLDPTKTNFSGWRGAIDQAKVGFREIQRWMVQRFFTPVYRWKVRQWIAEDDGLARMAGRPRLNPFKHKFNRPKWAYIEPLKDANAEDLRLSRNLTSPTRLFDERGEDWDEVHREIVADRAKLMTAAIETAAELNAKYPDAQVDWRELMGTQRPTKEASDQSDESDPSDTSDQLDGGEQP